MDRKGETKTENHYGSTDGTRNVPTDGLESMTNGENLLPVYVQNRLATGESERRIVNSTVRKTERQTDRRVKPRRQRFDIKDAAAEEEEEEE